MRDGIDDIIEKPDLSPFIRDIIEDGKFDNDLLEDSALFIVDDAIDEAKEAEEELLKGESLADSEMIDLIDDGDMIDDALSEGFLSKIKGAFSKGNSNQNSSKPVGIFGHMAQTRSAIQKGQDLEDYGKELLAKNAKMIDRARAASHAY